MKPISKILVPIDFADSSGEIVDAAVTLARTFNARLDFFHVWEPPAMLPMQLLVVPNGDQPPMAATDVARSMASAKLDELRGLARTAGVGDVQCHVGVGSPAHDIVDLAQKGNFDLIVMGTHGRTGLHHMLLGSVAEKVVRQAPCPVLTVRAHG
jgi:universal stress protein A